MEYSKNQLDFIQKRLFEIAPKLKDGGLGMMLTFSEFVTWVSHAQLAMYSVESNTGKMYKQKGNVRTYYDRTGS